MDNQDIKEDEIDLIELLQTVWNGRKTVLKFVVVFFLLGLFVAIFSPKEFTANTVVAPQGQSNKSGGNLGGLAAMAGISLGGGGGSSDVSPLLYPKVVKSVPFLRELLKVPLKFEGLDKEVTYEEYYTNHQKFNLLGAVKKYTIGLPGVILGAFKGRGKEEEVNVKVEEEIGIYKITKKEKALFGLIRGQLKVETNDEEGFVELSFSMPEAEPSAKMVQKAQLLLQGFITDFKVNKVKEELMFIEERYEEAKKDFDKKQYTLANFRDRNRGLSTSRSQTRLERLQSDYNLAFGVYSELAKKLEMQRIEVKKNTPVFTIIEPVSVPVQKSKPRRAMILVVWLFLGVVLGVGVVFGREWLKNIKVKRKTN